MMSPAPAGVVRRSYSGRGRCGMTPTDVVGDSVSSGTVLGCTSTTGSWAQAPAVCALHHAVIADAAAEADKRATRGNPAERDERRQENGDGDEHGNRDGDDGDGRR